MVRNNSERNQTVTPNEYQQLASRTDPDRTHRVVDKITEIAPNGSWLLHAQIGLAGEVGELATAIQKWLYYGKELDRINVIEELGDLCWYLAQACRAMDVQLEDVMRDNLNKLKFRYPERYTDFHAAEENRNRTGEREVLEAEEAYRKSCCDAMANKPVTPRKEVKGEHWASTTGVPKNPPVCPHCKTAISDRAKFCPECGNAV